MFTDMPTFNTLIMYASKSKSCCKLKHLFFILKYLYGLKYIKIQTK